MDDRGTLGGAGRLFVLLPQLGIQHGLVHGNVSLEHFALVGAVLPVFFHFYVVLVLLAPLLRLQARLELGLFGCGLFGHFLLKQLLWVVGIAQGEHLFAGQFHFLRLAGGLVLERHHGHLGAIVLGDDLVPTVIHTVVDVVGVILAEAGHGGVQIRRGEGRCPIFDDSLALVRFGVIGPCLGFLRISIGEVHVGDFWHGVFHEQITGRRRGLFGGGQCLLSGVEGLAVHGKLAAWLDGDACGGCGLLGRCWLRRRGLHHGGLLLLGGVGAALGFSLGVVLGAGWCGRRGWGVGCGHGGRVHSRGGWCSFGRFGFGRCRLHLGRGGVHRA